MSRAITEADVACVTPARCAELIARSRETVMAMIASGELPASKLGRGAQGRYSIRLRDIDALLNARRAA